MITVHHLDYSRSTRVLWLLEELSLEYQLVRYRRTAGGPAPKELKMIHPLGKSPAIVDGDLVLAESSAILRYLDLNYGDRRFSPSEKIKAAKHDEWIDFAEGSASFSIILTLMGANAGLSETLSAWVKRDLVSSLDWVANAVEKQQFLMGDDLTLADMQMSYLLAISSGAGLLKNHPAIEHYLGRLYERPALTRALEKGGPMTPQRL